MIFIKNILQLPVLFIFASCFIVGIFLMSIRKIFKQDMLTTISEDLDSIQKL